MNGFKLPSPGRKLYTSHMGGLVLKRSPHIATQMTVSDETLLRMDEDELQARCDYFVGQAREVTNASVDSENVALMSEVRFTAKLYLKEAMRTQVAIQVKRDFSRGGQKAQNDNNQPLEGR